MGAAEGGFLASSDFLGLASGGDGRFGCEVRFAMLLWERGEIDPGGAMETRRGDGREEDEADVMDSYRKW